MKRYMRKALIQNEKQLKAGKYIRASVNSEGEAFFHTEDVVGVPYTKKIGGYIGHSEQARAIKTKNLYNNYAYINDLMVHATLFKFSNRLLAELSKISDPIEFLEFITGNKLATDKRQYIKMEWRTNRNW